jgi:hypothetical protein
MTFEPQRASRQRRIDPGIAPAGKKAPIPFRVGSEELSAYERDEG